jgi:hypothetical protein
MTLDLVNRTLSQVLVHLAADKALQVHSEMLAQVGKRARGCDED